MGRGNNRNPEEKLGAYVYAVRMSDLIKVSAIHDCRGNDLFDYVSDAVFVNS